MECNHCHKQVTIVKEYRSNKIGAMIVAADTQGRIGVWPAMHGLKKYEGCVEFADTKSGATYLGSMFANGLAVKLTEESCLNLYFDVPEEGTAWLVTPGKDGYSWIRIDEKIEFSN